MSVAGRILGGTFGTVVIVSLAALVIDAGPAEAKPKRRHGRERHRDAGAEAASRADAGAGHDPGCLYGRVLDGHSGQVRCLSPEEVAPPGPYDWPEPADAGLADALPSPDAGAEPVRAADAGAAEAAEVKVRPTKVAVGSIAFEGGDVPRAKTLLDRLAKGALSTCASERGGVRGSGTVELRFLVRASGRAEGVDVGKVKGVPRAVVECLASTLARRPVGAPTAEPVGVTIVLDVMDVTDLAERQAPRR